MRIFLLTIQQQSIHKIVCKEAEDTELPLMLLVAVLFYPSYSQSVQKIHSHNDYWQLVPFYQAYSQRVSSIEADIYY